MNRLNPSAGRVAAAQFHPSSPSEPSVAAGQASEAPSSSSVRPLESAESEALVEPSRKRQKIDKYIVIAGAGSQGIALAQVASRNHAEHHREVVLLSRDVEKTRNLAFLQDGKRILVKDMPHVTVVSDLSGVEAEHTIVLATVPAAAVAGVLAALPKGKWEGVAATHNGVLPPGAAVPEHVHIVSLLGTGEVADSKGTMQITAPKPLIVPTECRFGPALQSIFGKGIPVVIKGEERLNQYAKVAANTAVNLLATLQGVQVGDIRKQIEHGAPIATLVEGITAETYCLAVSEGLKVPFDTFRQDVLQLIPPGMLHYTSTGLSFRKGDDKSVQADRDCFAGGIAGRLGERDDRPLAPVCESINAAMTTLTVMRGEQRDPQEFYKQEPLGRFLSYLGDPLLLQAAKESIGRAREAQPCAERRSAL